MEEGKSVVGPRTLKKKSRLYCEPLPKRLVMKNHGIFNGVAIKFRVKLGKAGKEKTYDTIKEPNVDAAMRRLGDMRISAIVMELHR